MKESKLDALRELYRSWSTDDLLRAMSSKPGNYEPEAITLMLEELSARGVSAPTVAAERGAAEEQPKGQEPSRQNSSLPGFVGFVVGMVLMFYFFPPRSPITATTVMVGFGFGAVGGMLGTLVGILLNKKS